MTTARLMMTFALLAALGASTACGRKADLDTPYEAGIQARKDAKRNGQPVPPEPAKPDDDKPFVLDKLIQ